MFFLACINRFLVFFKKKECIMLNRRYFGTFVKDAPYIGNIRYSCGRRVLFLMVSQPQIERFRGCHFFMRYFRDMDGKRTPLVYDTVHTDVAAMHLDVFL
jgi:hypothetical protein